MNDEKLIKINWVAPNGKNYKENISMTSRQYTEFVNNLWDIKQKKPHRLTQADSIKRNIENVEANLTSLELFYKNIKQIMESVE